MLYERLLRPLLFRLDPEAAHHAVSTMLGIAQSVPGGALGVKALAGLPPGGLETEALGIKFPNPLGLAAGFDKDCSLTQALSALGFGFLELGSVTLRPQEGNPKPRLFRLPEQQALINRMGFNSAGVEAAVKALSRAGRQSIPIAVNLGLNKDCPKDRAPQEYALTFKALAPYASYVALNVSSPNTTGLRDLQERRHLERILKAIAAVNAAGTPVLVKLAPDLSDDALADLVETAQRSAAGVVATNTTLSRDGLPGDLPDIRGGLSGAPLRARSTELIRRIRRLSAGRLPIIGVGGIFSGADALEKLRAGASLVQLYTGLVYGGPSAATRILRELKGLLALHGFKSVAEAVGSEDSGL